MPNKSRFLPNNQKFTVYFQKSIIVLNVAENTFFVGHIFKAKIEL